MEADRPLTTVQAAKLYHPATSAQVVLRHIMRGVRTTSNGRVKLQATKLGGRWATTETAVRRFLELAGEAAV